MTDEELKKWCGSAASIQGGRQRVEFQTAKEIPIEHQEEILCGEGGSSSGIDCRGGGVSLSGDFQVEAHQTPSGDTPGGFQATGSGLDKMTL